MRAVTIKLILIAAAMLLPVACFAGDAAAGKDKSKVCAACHGENGISQTADFPKLAGQYQTYMKRALADYKSGQRKNPIMAAQVATLSATDIDDLVEFFSSQQALATKY